MLMAPHYGQWWRFSRYEIRDGIIQPQEEAELEEYDPWAEYEDSRAWGEKSTAPPTPYLALASLVHMVRFDVRHNLTPESEEAVLNWCSKYGLLGILPHYLQRLPPEVVDLGFPEDHGWWEKPGFLYEGGDWVEQSLDNFLEPITIDKLQRYFPGQPLDRWGQPCPKPLTPEFWAVYGEPVQDFLDQCQSFVDAISELGNASPEELGGVGSLCEGQYVLNQLSASVTPLIEISAESRRFVLRWRFRSLLASLAMMVLQDLTENRRVFTCQNCGTVFVSHSPKAAYCGNRCRKTAEKRRQRDRQRSRVHEEES